MSAAHKLQSNPIQSQPPTWPLKCSSPKSVWEPTALSVNPCYLLLQADPRLNPSFIQKNLRSLARVIRLDAFGPLHVGDREVKVHLLCPIRCSHHWWMLGPHSALQSAFGLCECESDYLKFGSELLGRIFLCVFWTNVKKTNKKKGNLNLVLHILKKVRRMSFPIHHLWGHWNVTLVVGRTIQVPHLQLTSTITWENGCRKKTNLSWF